MNSHASRPPGLRGTIEPTRTTHSTGEVPAHAFAGHMIEPAASAESQGPSDTRRNTPIRMLPVDQVVGLTGLSKTRVYVLQRNGDFPMRVQLTPGRVAWVEADVQAWLAARIASNRPLRAR